MRHHFVAVQQGDDRAGDERAEDHLEAEFIRDGCEANEKDDCGSHTDLSGGVLKPEQVASDAHRMLCASHRAEDHDGKYRQSTEEQKRRPDSAFAGEEQGEQDDGAEVRDRRRCDDELAEGRGDFPRVLQHGHDDSERGGAEDDRHQQWGLD
jgi:hypothetical protein